MDTTKNGAKPRRSKVDRAAEAVLDVAPGDYAALVQAIIERSPSAYWFLATAFDDAVPSAPLASALRRKAAQGDPELDPDFQVKP